MTTGKKKAAWKKNPLHIPTHSALQNIDSIPNDCNSYSGLESKVYNIYRLVFVEVIRKNTNAKTSVYWRNQFRNQDSWKELERSCEESGNGHLDKGLVIKIKL